MKPIWIIENITNESSYQELSQAVDSLGYKSKLIKGDYKNSDLLEYKNDLEFVIFNGSIEMSKLIKKQLPHCFPLLYSTYDNYLCSRYYTYFGNKLFNDKYALISLKEFYRNKFLFYGFFGKESLIFIRPDSGEKTFQAQLLDLLDIDKFIERHRDIQNELVLISSPKEILWEGRFVVSKHKEIIAKSTYRFQGQITKIPSVPEGSQEFVKEILEIGYFPDSVFCIDVCQTKDNQFYLLELTSFSSAGLYSSNKVDIVKRVSEIAEQDYDEKYNK